MNRSNTFKNIKNILKNRFYYRIETNDMFIKALQKELTKLELDINSISIYITDSRKEYDDGKVYFREQLNIIYRSDVPEPYECSRKIHLFAETKYYDLNITVLSNKDYNEVIYGLYKVLIR